MALGWILAAYSVPQWCWIGTLMVLLHLSTRGKAAIPVALVWSNLMLLIAAYIYATPSSFEWDNAKEWALSLLGLWLGAIAITVLIAQTPSMMQDHKTHRLKNLFSIITLIAGSLGLGHLLYHMGQTSGTV